MSELIFEKHSRNDAEWLPDLAEQEKDLLKNFPSASLRKKEAELPSLSELDVVRHFTRLSHKNFSVDANFYPLGSCTMKYNPKFTEKIAAMPGFADLHPLLPQLKGGERYVQGGA